MKLLSILSLSLFVTTATAFAGSIVDTSCDPSWKTCLKSYSTDMDSTLHYVGAIQAGNVVVNFLASSPVNLIIENQSGSVLVRTAKDGSPDVLVGQINQAIDSIEVKSALSRGLNLSAGLTSNLTSKDGGRKTFCNQTALGFVYERYTYNTLDNTFTISKDGKALFTAQSNESIQPAVSVHSSIIPCAK